MTDLTFISISHPDDIKTAENKTKIARMAMINRPGKPAKPTRQQPQAQARSAPTRPPARAESRTALVTSRQRIPFAASSYSPPRGRNSQVTSPDEFNNALSPRNIYPASDISSPPGLLYNGASPESTGISPPQLSQVNSNESAAYEQYGQPMDNNYFPNVDHSDPRSNGFASNNSCSSYATAGSVISPPSDEESSARSDSVATTINSVDSRAIQRKREEQNNTTTAVAKPRRINKKTLARRQLMNPPADQEMHVQLDPMAQLIGALLDPFNSMPMGANKHTQELLYQYVGAYLMSPQLGGPGSPVHKRLTASRKNLWWPMVQNSKAALAALIVYVETTPGLANKSPSEDYLQIHQSIALKAIIDSITETATRPNQAADDAICFAIVLLMIAAQRTHDKQATQSHASGLKKVLAERAKAFQRNRRLENTTAEKGTRISGPDNPTDITLKCKYCRLNATGEPNSRESSPDIPEATFTVALEKIGSGFTTLIDEGEMSHSMQAFIETSLEWNIIAQQARKDRLSAACGASHAWTDGNSEVEASTPLDNAVMYSVRIALYLSAWLDWNHECDAVKKMVFAVNMSLKRLDSTNDMEHLLLQYPEVILWATLLVGPYTEEMKPETGEAPLTEENTLRYFMLKLAGRAAERVIMKFQLQQGSEAPMSFDDILVDISNKYLWTSTMTPAAQAFYHDGTTLWQSLQPRISQTPNSVLEDYAQELNSMVERQHKRDLAQDMIHNAFTDGFTGIDSTTSMAPDMLQLDEFGQYEELLNPNLVPLQDDFLDYNMHMNNLGQFDQAAMNMPMEMIGPFDETAMMMMPMDGYIMDDMVMAMGHNVQDMSIYDQMNFGQQDDFVWVPDQNEMDGMDYMDGAMNQGQYYTQNDQQQ